MDSPRGTPAQAAKHAPRRPQSGQARSATPSATPRARAVVNSRPASVRAHTTPNDSIAHLSASTSHTSSTGSTPAHVRATPTSGRHAYQGTVRVAGMRRAATEAPNSAPTLGTGARVVSTRTGPPRIARTGTTSSVRASPDSVRGHTMPRTGDIHHNERLNRVARRSPTSPTSEVRTAGRASPARDARSRLPPQERHRASPSPTRRSASECPVGTVAPVPAVRARSDLGAAPRAADLSNSFFEVGGSAGGSALGTPTGTHAHPFTPHVAGHATPVASTPPPGLDAKHERKLLDLEISNKSLLAINTALESTKVQQAKELRALRQQMFHTQLERASDPNEVYGLEADAMAPGLSELLDSTKLQDKESLPAQLARALAQQDEELQEMHTRCRHAIDAMLDEARAALLAQPNADAGKSRVLHASELHALGSSSEEESSLAQDTSQESARPSTAPPHHFAAQAGGTDLSVD